MKKIKTILGLFCFAALIIFVEPIFAEAADCEFLEESYLNFTTENMEVVSLIQENEIIDNAAVTTKTTVYENGIIEIETLTIMNNNLLNSRASGFVYANKNKVVKDGTWTVIDVTLYATFSYDGAEAKCISKSREGTINTYYNLTTDSLSSGKYTYSIIGIEYKETEYARWSYSATGSLSGSEKTFSGTIELECNKDGGIS